MPAEMTSSKIDVLAVDDSRTVLMMLSDMIAAGGDMRLVATASTGQDAMRRALELRPDVILMDINLPDMDGIEVTWYLSPKLPDTSIIMVTSEESTAMVQRAMLAGAQAYLTKPLSQDAVLQTIRNVRGRHLERMSRVVGTARRDAGPIEPAREPHPRGRRIVLFGAKGGVGKTTIAANLAVVLKERTGKEVALVDADFCFGDLSLHLNVASRATIVDLLSKMADLDSALLEGVMAVHSSGVKVLAAPPRPEQGEMVKVEHVTPLLTAVPRFYDYIVVDCQQNYDDRVLAALDRADLILLVLTPEIAPVRNAKHFVRLAHTLGYAEDKVMLVLNRADSNVGITPGEIKQALGAETLVQLPSAGRELVVSVNEGRIFALDTPKAPWSRALLDLAQQVETRLAQAISH